MAMEKQIPSVSDATIETFFDIFSAIVSETRKELNPSTVLISIENLESLPTEEVAKTFMALRDTFFSTSGTTFVIMGRDNLMRELEYHDQRIAQKIRQPVIGLRPFNSDELHKLVGLRVKKYRSKGQDINKSPVSQEIHDLIFKASGGIPRLALQRSEEVVNRVFVDAEIAVIEKLSRPNHNLTKAALDAITTKAIDSVLIENQISSKYAYRELIRLCLESLYPEENADAFASLAKKLAECRFGADQAPLDEETRTSLVDLAGSMEPMQGDDNQHTNKRFSRFVITEARDALSA